MGVSNQFFSVKQFCFYIEYVWGVEQGDKKLYMRQKNQLKQNCGNVNYGPFIFYLYFEYSHNISRLKIFKILHISLIIDIIIGLVNCFQYNDKIKECRILKFYIYFLLFNIKWSSHIFYLFLFHMKYGHFHLFCFFFKYFY